MNWTLDEQYRRKLDSLAYHHKKDLRRYAVVAGTMVVLLLFAAISPTLLPVVYDTFYGIWSLGFLVLIVLDYRTRRSKFREERRAFYIVIWIISFFYVLGTLVESHTFRIDLSRQGWVLLDLGWALCLLRAIYTVERDYAVDRQLITIAYQCAMNPDHKDLLLDLV